MSAPMDRSQLVAVGVCEECRFNVCLQSQARPFTSPRFAKNAGATLTGVTPLDNDAGWFRSAATAHIPCRCPAALRANAAYPRR
jgi:hypothetical protein